MRYFTSHISQCKIYIVIYTRFGLQAAQTLYYLKNLFDRVHSDDTSFAPSPDAFHSARQTIRLQPSFLSLPYSFCCPRTHPGLFSLWYPSRLFSAPASTSLPSQHAYAPTATPAITCSNSHHNPLQISPQVFLFSPAPNTSCSLPKLLFYFNFHLSQLHLPLSLLYCTISVLCTPKSTNWADLFSDDAQKKECHRNIWGNVLFKVSWKFPVL